MIHVEHDPTAGTAASHACREAAARCTTVAAWLDAEPGTVAWWGCGRDHVVRAAHELADELRREAGALHLTADLLDAGVRAARRAEEDRAAELRAAVGVPVTGHAPGWGPAPVPVTAAPPVAPPPPRPAGGPWAVPHPPAVVPAAVR